MWPLSYRISIPLVSKNTVTELSPCCQQSLIAFLLLSRPDNLGSAIPRHSHQADGKSGHAGFFIFFISHQVDPLFHSFCVAELYISFLDYSRNYILKQTDTCTYYVIYFSSSSIYFRCLEVKQGQPGKSLLTEDICQVHVLFRYLANRLLESKKNETKTKIAKTRIVMSC